MIAALALTAVAAAAGAVPAGDTRVVPFGRVEVRVVASTKFTRALESTLTAVLQPSPGGDALRIRIVAADFRGEPPATSSTLFTGMAPAFRLRRYACDARLEVEASGRSQALEVAHTLVAERADPGQARAACTRGLAEKVADALSRMR